MALKSVKECPYYLISRVSLVVTSALKKGFADAGVQKVRPAYLCVMMSLWEEDGLKVIELGKKAGLEPSSMTGLLDRMERDGLVSRTMDPRDRRVLRIYLNESGQNARDPILNVIDDVLADVFAGISKEDISHTKNLLRHVLANAHEGSM
jgi:DNA-binding MarR family transcriptional regulator